MVPAFDAKKKASLRPSWPWLLALLLALLLAGFGVVSWWTFPGDQSPEGAYLRIVKAVNQGQAEQFFAYTEEEAQHACFTIQQYRAQSLRLIEESFPVSRRTELVPKYKPFAEAAGGAGVFALMVEREGWLSQLRGDVSGIAEVVEIGERATIVTARGTRYSMRRRPGGIWGLTAFTATLVEEAQRAARDHAQVEKAARDFERGRASGQRSSEPGSDLE